MRHLAIALVLAGTTALALPRPAHTQTVAAPRTPAAPVLPARLNIPIQPSIRHSLTLIRAGNGRRSAVQRS